MVPLRFANIFCFDAGGWEAEFCDGEYQSFTAVVTIHWGIRLFIDSKVSIKSVFVVLKIIVQYSPVAVAVCHALR